jgi:replicative DNA helicase
MDFEEVPDIKKAEQITDGESAIVTLAEAARLLEASRNGSDYFPMGFDLFSEIMGGGITEGDLVVISGKSGHGKTTFAQTLSYHLAGPKVAVPQLWFSYEMQVTEIWKKFRDMGVNEEFLGFCPLKLKSSNVEWIEQKITEGILKFNTKIVFIDHLGFLSPRVNSSNAMDFERNFSAYLGQLVRQLKTLAREKRIIIFLLAHVRKTKEELDIDDLAHSVGIAQEADFVFMVERERVKPLTSRQQLQNQSAPSIFSAEGDVFTKYSKVFLVKNRRTGINKFIKCQMANGRLTEVVQSNGSELTEQNRETIIG